jgi:hypothetical protein
MDRADAQAVDWRTLRMLLIAFAVPALLFFSTIRLLDSPVGRMLGHDASQQAIATRPRPRRIDNIVELSDVKDVPWTLSDSADQD